MQESTRIKDGFVDLGSQEDARFRNGQLYIRQDGPAMENSETIELDAHAQFALLQALYERRYAIYRATTLQVGDNDIPSWIASGKADALRIVDAGNQGGE